MTANRSSKGLRGAFNLIREEGINGGRDIMSVTTVKFHKKLTKLNGGYKHIDRYILISCKEEKS